MANVLKLVNGYLMRLLNASIPRMEFEQILKEINNLVNEFSNKPISQEDKSRIVSIIIDRLLEIRRSEVWKSGNIDKITVHPNLENVYINDKYLELIEYIKDRTNK